jgi:pyruvate-ferredoxin/flavodoxin oxidoreductase
MNQQKLAVDSGMWTLFRYDPRLKAQGKNPLKLDSKEPEIDVEEYMYNEIRFRSLKQYKPERAEIFLNQARKDAKERYQKYKYLADQSFG